MEVGENGEEEECDYMKEKT